MLHPDPQSPDFRLIADNTYDWESWITLDGRLAWVSPSVRRVTGFDEAECQAMANYPLPLIAPAHRPEVQEALRQGLAGWCGNDLPLHILHKNGSGVAASLSWQPMVDAAGTGLGVRLSVRDLTGSVRVGDAWRYGRALSDLVRGVSKEESLEHRLRGITETAAVTLGIVRAGIWLFDESGETLICTDVFDRPTGQHLNGTRLERADYPRYFLALDNERAIEAYDAGADPRTSELAEVYLTPLNVRAMLDSPIVRAGKTVGVLCNEHAGTPRHWMPEEVGFASSLADLIAMALETEENRQLDSLQRRLASILEATPDFVCTCADQEQSIYINPAGRQLLGFEASEAWADWSLRDIYPNWAWEFRQRVVLPTAIRQGMWCGEIAIRDRWGQEIPASQVLIVHKDGDGTVRATSTIIRDLREQKRIEAALRERERFLSSLVANLPGVAYRRRNAPGWPMEYLSQGCLALTGYPAERIMADDPGYDSLVHPDDHERIFAGIEAAMAERRFFEVEYRLVRADGREIWVWSKGRGIHNEAGDLIAHEGFIGDVTARVQAQLDLRRLNADLEERVADRTVRLKEANQQLESFAYSVAHDLKAPLRGIDGFSKLLLEDYHDQLPDEAQRFLHTIRSASLRMNQLIEDLLAYSRLERRELASGKVDLTGLIARVLAERAEPAHRISVEVGELAVRGDPEALLQAVRNLIDNAIKFSRGAANPEIAIRAETRGGKVLLSVADNGCGFDQKYHDRIFEIFQRLHRSEDYPGTGVGLAIVRKVVERMGGRVWAQGRIGLGSTFFLELPS